jgi:hypothetical protein
MAINWTTIGNNIAALTSALTAAGVSSTTMPSVLSTIGSLFNSNPNEAAELALCAQILQFANQPALISELSVRLATEQGIPADAAALALGLTTPGVDVATRVTQIEQLIRSEG